MLLKTKDIKTNEKPPANRPEVFCLDENSSFHHSNDILTRSITELKQNTALHFYSWANFNLVKLINHLIQFTGPVNLLMSSYSFSSKSIESLLRRKTEGLFLSVRILTDNRVKTMSPKPFQMLCSSFDVRTISIHAKVALLWNDNWKVAIVTSQNATDNPKLERGVIYTIPDVFWFDHKILENEFIRGTAAGNN